MAEISRLNSNSELWQSPVIVQDPKFQLEVMSTYFKEREKTQAVKEF